MMKRWYINVIRFVAHITGQKGRIMTCNICGAQQKPGTAKCTKCGAVLKSNYLLSDSEYTADSYRKKGESRRKIKRRYFIRLSIIIALILALILGSFAFFEYQHDNKEKPELVFYTGTGIINDDEKIIYLTIEDSSTIEFIHGVNIYDGDVTKSIKKPDPLSSDYDYTKNAADSFRAIFFDADNFKIDKNKKYTYTFEIVFGFAGDNNFYTYTQAIEFAGDIKDDVSDIIFDHSLNKELPESLLTTKKNSENEKTTEPTTQKQKEYDVDSAFIYNGFWFTQPYSVAESHYISAWKFNRNNTISVTSYSYINKKWTSEKLNISYHIDHQYLYVDNGENTESTKFILNDKEKTIIQIDEQTGRESVQLNSRKYNSQSNVEDFFGM